VKGRTGADDRAPSNHKLKRNCVSTDGMIETHLGMGEVARSAPNTGSASEAARFSGGRKRWDFNFKQTLIKCGAVGIADCGRQSCGLGGQDHRTTEREGAVVYLRALSKSQTPEVDAPKDMNGAG
jgi:hypothetical protein